MSMIYTELTKRAMQISYAAHKDQEDKGGIPYVYHPWHLAEQMDDEISVCVALLHDVVEDTRDHPCPVDLDLLREEGFPDAVIEALRCLTHERGEPYMTYIRRVGENALACKIKLADLIHNSDISRLKETDRSSNARSERYRQAIQELTSLSHRD